MKYIVDNDKIIMQEPDEFSIRQIFDCGQIFRYEIINDKYAFVVSLDHWAFIETYENKVEIYSDDSNYFINFFDLQTDYKKIKSVLSKDKYLKPCCEYGKGIRILKQNTFETMVGFIISANNNIKRIKNSLNFMAYDYGTKIEINNHYVNNVLKKILSSGYNSKIFGLLDNQIVYYAFPTLKQFKQISVEGFTKAGLGYRAEQLYDTIQNLNDKLLDDFQTFKNDEKKKFLISLKGIGQKVASCIMIFSEGDMSSFPVDTWIDKVYRAIIGDTISNRTQIESYLTNKYKDLSSYAQQYFFYYYRENKIK